MQIYGYLVVIHALRLSDSFHSAVDVVYKSEYAKKKKSINSSQIQCMHN